MLGSGVLPAALFLVALFFVPESPRWLTKRGRTGEAMMVLARVGGQRQAESEMREIQEAIAREGGSWSELFRPGVRLALGIAVVLAVLQQVTGINAVLYYAPKIFESAEVTATQALLQTIAVNVINLVFTLMAIQVVDRGGRKPLLLTTAGAMGVSLVLLAAAFHLKLSAAWIFAFTLAYVASFAVAMGPVVWVVLSEIFPTSIRGRAMSVATLPFGSPVSPSPRRSPGCSSNSASLRPSAPMRSCAWWRSSSSPSMCLKPRARPWRRSNEVG